MDAGNRDFKSSFLRSGACDADDPVSRSSVALQEQLEGWQSLHWSYWTEINAELRSNKSEDLDANGMNVESKPSSPDQKPDGLPGNTNTSIMKNLMAVLCKDLDEYKRWFGNHVTDSSRVPIIHRILKYREMTSQ